VDSQKKIISIPVLSGEVFEALPESIRSYIRYLEGRLQQLETRVHELEERLSKDSSNSSKPPSSDGLKRKPKSLRKQSGKKPGGQQGHAGKGLAQVNSPDVVVTHTPSSCTGCGSDLSSVRGTIAEQRQVFDIPQPKVNVTEHRLEEKKCPCCGRLTKASFPENIKGPVQYGDRVRALIAYFSHQHFIPVDRVCEIFEDIFGIAISPGTCANVDEQLFANLGVFEAGLKAHLLAAHVLHFDETGVRCAKKLHWVHVAASQTATFYIMHIKRGQEAIDAADILPHFQGTAVHDHWFPYFAYSQAKHGLCNAHHLRELTFIYEQKKEDWAKRMQELLIQANQKVEKNAECGALSPEILLQIEQSYSQILAEGFTYHESLPPLPTGKRGKPKQRDGKNLLDRLKEKCDCVLRFVHDFSVPFTNNQGERDIRMVKLKQKIAGCFRAFYGGEVFCRVRSYISTARKQGWNIWDSLANAIRGSPNLLDASQCVALQVLAV
jgi:transposase